MRLVITALALASAPAFAQDQPRAAPLLAPNEVLVEIEATGKVMTRPDTVSFSAGATTTASSAQAALEENSRLVERLLLAIRKAGVASADIRTSELQVSPRLAGDEDGTVAPRILGYIARNQLDVRIRDLRRAPTLLSELLAAGANDLQGPQFSLDDSKSALAAARRNAIEEARIQAQAYADALGMRVNRAIRVTERSRRVDLNGSIVVTASIKQGVPVEPGLIETSVGLWVDFALAKKVD